MSEQRRDYDAIKKIIVHCSDSDNPDHDNIETIKEWHLQRGFDDVGYHYFICKDGKIETGRPLWKIGAHCLNQNSDSIGVCFSGKKYFTEKQFESCDLLFCDLFDVLGMKQRDKNIGLYVYPHCYFSKTKTCPNFDIREISKWLIRSMVYKTVAYRLQPAFLILLGLKKTKYKDKGGD